MPEGAIIDEPPGDPSTGSSGLACLVAIGRTYGLHLAVANLAARHGLGPGEPSLEQLAACAQAAGFRSRPLVLGGLGEADLHRALPAIVRLRDGSSRVLQRLEVRDGMPEVVLLDPRAGDAAPTTLGSAAFARIWSGGIILLKASPAGASVETSSGRGTLRAMIVADGQLLRDGAIATVVLSVLALAPILFAQALLGEALNDEARQTYVFLCLGFAVLVLFETAFAAVRRGLVTRLSTRIRLRLDTLLVGRVLRMPLGVFERIPVGGIAHAVGRTDTIRAALAGPLAALLLDAAVALTMLVAMATISVLLTVVVLGLGAALAVVILLLLPRHRRATTALAAAEAETEAFLAQTLGGFGTVKRLALEPRQRQRWDVLTARTTRLRLAEAQVAGGLQSVGRLIERAMVFGTFALGVAVALATTKPLPQPALVAFLLLAWRAAEPLRDLAVYGRAVNTTRVSLAALAALDERPVEVDGGARPVIRGQVSFANVTFTYPDAPVPALTAVTFDVSAGSTLGIIGRSGAGKSTIARLMQRLHGDHDGLVKLDGVDVREFDLDHLRQGVAVVTQDSALFPGTLRETILAARPDAGDEAMVLAARLVGADAFIEALPHGYDTLLREDGAPLSQGERQRLAIARALVAEPKVLVLDEATSALDPESEALLAGNLKRIGEGRTVIIIAQRLATLVHADAILVLDRGEVQDIGRHSDLVERSDIYAALWQRQTARVGRPPPAGRRLTRGASVA